jgi:hypothetical protein
MTEKTYLPLHVEGVDKYLGGLLPGELVIVHPTPLIWNSRVAAITMKIVLRKLVELQQHWTPALPVISLGVDDITPSRFQEVTNSIHNHQSGREVKDHFFFFVEVKPDFSTVAATHLLRMLRTLAKEIGLVVVVVFKDDATRLGIEADIVMEVSGVNNDNLPVFQFSKIRRVDLPRSREEINQSLIKAEGVESQQVKDEIKIQHVIHELINQETVDLGEEAEPRQGDVRKVLCDYLLDVLPGVGVSVGLNHGRVEVYHHSGRSTRHVTVATLPVCLVKHVFGLA